MTLVHLPGPGHPGVDDGSMITRPARTVVILLAVLVATVGCSRQDDLVGQWADPTGQPLPDGTPGANGVLVVHTYLASSHCEGWKDTVYLELAWPVGRGVNIEDAGGVNDLRYYVRGESVEKRVSSEPYAADVALPASATPTGFARAGNAISVDPAGPAYVTRPDGRTERWPQIVLGCA